MQCSHFPSPFTVPLFPVLSHSVSYSLLLILELHQQLSFSEWTFNIDQRIIYSNLSCEHLFQVWLVFIEPFLLPLNYLSHSCYIHSLQLDRTCLVMSQQSVNRLLINKFVIWLERAVVTTMDSDTDRDEATSTSFVVTPLEGTQDGLTWVLCLCSAVGKSL